MRNQHVDEEVLTTLYHTLQLQSLSKEISQRNPRHKTVSMNIESND